MGSAPCLPQVWLLHAGDVDEASVFLIAQLTGHFTELLGHADQAQVQVKLSRELQNPVPARWRRSELKGQCRTFDLCLQCSTGSPGPEPPSPGALSWAHWVWLFLLPLPLPDIVLLTQKSGWAEPHSQGRSGREQCVSM